jgi:ArsR family transcriptional regulator
MGYGAAALAGAFWLVRVRSSCIVQEYGPEMITLQHPATIDQSVEALKFLSDANRLRILAALAQAETCVCDLIDELGLSQTLVSYHLGKLRKMGLVRVRREAQWSYYSLDSDAWQQLVAPLASLLAAAPLPPGAQYGASHRCDTVPADPSKGAGAEDDDSCLSSTSASCSGSERSPLTAGGLGALFDDVLAHSTTRAGSPART